MVIELCSSPHTCHMDSLAFILSMERMGGELIIASFFLQAVRKIQLKKVDNAFKMRKARE